jgi:hypothetical protein
MDTYIVLVYCLCDDMLIALNHTNDSQCQLSDAEIMTIAIVAAKYFGGNFAAARRFLSEHGYITGTISRGRFSVRLHRVSHHFQTLFNCLGEVWKTSCDEQLYAIDTFPIAVCDNYRISRSQIYQSEAYRGYQASKKRYFYGLKLHMMVTKDFEPVEFFLTPGSHSDSTGLKQFSFDLPAGATVFGDKAYNNYRIEDSLAEHDIHLLPFRKKNSKRPLPPWMHYLQARFRKAVETTGSMLERLLPKSIHATNAAGFELKIALFALVVSINCIQTPEFSS